MNVLVIGGLGFIGQRYCAILRYLGINYKIDDTKEAPYHLHRLSGYSFDKAIIASPTGTHHFYSKLLLNMGKKFLCEKPLSTDLKECEELRNIDGGFVVNNYEFLYRKKFGYFSKKVPAKISYNYYKTGPHGLAFDCSQLIYMSRGTPIELGDTSPVWNLEINNEIITYRELEESYIDMIKAFLFGYDESNDERENYLWTMEDGYQMTKAVLEYESRNIHTST